MAGEDQRSPEEGHAVKGYATLLIPLWRIVEGDDGHIYLERWTDETIGSTIRFGKSFEEHSEARKYVELLNTELLASIYRVVYPTP